MLPTRPGHCSQGQALAGQETTGQGAWRRRHRQPAEGRVVDESRAAAGDDGTGKRGRQYFLHQALGQPQDRRGRDRGMTAGGRRQRRSDPLVANQQESAVGDGEGFVGAVKDGVADGASKRLLGAPSLEIRKVHPLTRSTPGLNHYTSLALMQIRTLPFNTLTYLPADSMMLY